MANLRDTAAITKDLYYQDYRSDESFFNDKHFMYLCGVAYSKLLEDEYKEIRRESRAEEGIAVVWFQQDWLFEEEVEMKLVHGDLYEGKISKPIFSFPFDYYGRGVQTVARAGETKCGDFIRSGSREAWMDCILPKTKKVFFVVKGGSIIQARSGVCAIDKIVVEYIPEITDDSFGEEGGPVPKAKEELIIRKTLDLMIQARQGVVADTTNNSNPNKALQTEVDTVFNSIKPKSGQ